MGCGCKTKTVKDKLTGELIEVDGKNGNIIVNFTLFLLSILILPLLFPVIVVMLFNHFMIGGNVDIVSFVKKFKNLKKEEVDETVDIDEINPDEYELIGVDIISNDDKMVRI